SHSARPPTHTTTRRRPPPRCVTLSSGRAMAPDYVSSAVADGTPTQGEFDQTAAGVCAGHTSGPYRTRTCDPLRVMPGRQVRSCPPSYLTCTSHRISDLSTSTERAE